MGTVSVCWTTLFSSNMIPSNILQVNLLSLSSNMIPTNILQVNLLSLSSNMIPANILQVNLSYADADADTRQYPTSDLVIITLPIPDTRQYPPSELVIIILQYDTRQYPQLHIQLQCIYSITSPNTSALQWWQE